MADVDVAATQQAVAGANAAVYAYGVVAAALSGTDRTRALTAMAAHRSRRDRLRAWVVAAAATPTPAAAAYDLPSDLPLTDGTVGAAAARVLAATVEDRCSGQLAELAAACTGTARASAAAWAQECAVRGVVWSGVAPVWAGSD